MPAALANGWSSGAQLKSRPTGGASEFLSELQQLRKKQPPISASHGVGALAVAILLAFVAACGPQASGPTPFALEQEKRSSDLPCLTCKPPPPPPPFKATLAISATVGLHTGSSTTLYATANSQPASGITWSVVGGGSFSNPTANAVTYTAPTFSGASPISVTVTASGSAYNPGSLTLTIGPSPIAFNPNSLATTAPQGLTAGIAYVNHQCETVKNAFAFTWQLGASLVGFIATCASAINNATVNPDGGVNTFGGCATSFVNNVAAFINAGNGASYTTCGAPSIFVTGYGADGKFTLYSTSTNGRASFGVHTPPDAGWVAGADGDFGPDNLPGTSQQSNFGFYHQELTTGLGPADSEVFQLPPGTTCGFHHSINTKPPEYGTLGTCMGYDAADGPNNGGCPAGWLAKLHLDESSNPPGYFAWCEYQDPYGYCANGNPTCLQNARALGLGLLVASDTDIPGETTLGYACPAGFTRTAYYDDGRVAATINGTPPTLGLSWCLPLWENLPQGLTMGLTFFDPLGPGNLGAYTPVNPGNVSGSALGALTLDPSPTFATPFSVGVVTTNDGDLNACCSNVGFAHQYLAAGGVTDTSLSETFVLPPGTACGFHHSINTPGLTCMGKDPLSGCPAGWNQRIVPEPGTGASFAWCEYQDPNNNCLNDPQGSAICFAFADNIGVTLDIEPASTTPGCAGADFVKASANDGLTYCVAQ